VHFDKGCETENRNAFASLRSVRADLLAATSALYARIIRSMLFNRL